MMTELVWLFVLTLVSVVTPTPYGYGVKGGAAAKAEASATAGAISAAPLPFPTGNGFSGSYSKSSSSSFASSSASSSSSSFSYNGANSGALNFGNQGLAGHDDSKSGSSPCASGKCQFGIDGQQNLHGGSAESSANADAVAAANAKAGQSGCSTGDCKLNGGNGQYSYGASGTGYGFNNPSGAPGIDTSGSSDCTDSSCKGKKSGECKGTDCKEISKCTSGECSSNLASGDSAAGHGSADSDSNGSSSNNDSNDIRVITVHKSPYGSNHDSSNVDKTPIGYTGSECATGSCGSPSSSYNSQSKPDSSGHILAPSKPYDSTKKDCSNGACAPTPAISGSPISPNNYPYLTPNLPTQTGSAPSTGHQGSGPSCTYGNCGSSSNSKPITHPTQSGPSPSSGYDISNHLPKQPVPASAAYNVDEPSKHLTAPIAHPTQSGISPAGGYEISNNLPKQPVPAPASHNVDEPSKHLTVPKDENTCSSPPCLGNYNKPSSYDVPIHSNPDGSQYETPICTSANCNKSPSHASPSQNGGIKYPTSSISIGSTVSYTPSASIKPTSPTKPNDKNLPAYTGGFGAPSGILNPNEPGIPGKLPSSNYYNTPNNSPLCTSGNCVPQTASSPVHSGSGNCGNGQCTTYSLGQIGVSPGNNAPNYSPSSSSTYNLNQPKPNIDNFSPASYKPETSQGNQPNGDTTHQVNPGSYSTQPGLAPKPSYNTPHPNIPSSNLNIGVASQPTGSLSSGINAGATYQPHVGSSSQPNEPHPQHNNAPNQPNYNVGSIVTGCTTPDCGNNAYGSKGHATSNSAIKPEKPAYTGGFGAPFGLLNPTGVSGSPHTSKSETSAAPCTSGSCGLQSAPTHNSPAQPAHIVQSGSISGAKATASAAASANAIAYAGGFGGPPGFLKPHDDDKSGANIDITGKHSGSGYTKPNNGVPNTVFGNSLNGGGVGLQAAAGAQASAVAGASSGISSGGYQHVGNGQGGLEHTGAGGCNTGCGSSGSGHYGNSFGLSGSSGLSNSDGVNGGLSGASAAAKSNAGALSGAYGPGGSYASSSASAHASAGSYTKGGYGK